MSILQLSLFDPPAIAPVRVNEGLKAQRSGTFIDNMKLPIHRWFRYSAGFSAEWVRQIIHNEQAQSILDPFSGSGTVNIVADEIGIPSFGYEAHPFIYKISSAKTHWAYNVTDFLSASRELLDNSNKYATEKLYLNNKLLSKCYNNDARQELLRLKAAWLDSQSVYNKSLSELLFLAITSILRSTSVAGTAQWQYILPEKRKSKAIQPYNAFIAQTMMMADDMRYMQRKQSASLADIFHVDSRELHNVNQKSVDLVVTSPPYANNYDYADATRLEMTFWGNVSSWGDLHDTVRKYLICSSAQHASKERYVLQKVLHSSYLSPIINELTGVCHELAIIRETKGGKKHYHTMIASYFNDMSKIFVALRKIVRHHGKMFFVIGDSAPYGVHVPVEKWLGNLAVAAGFQSWSFDKIRARNIKWKNRKHRVPLHEGILSIVG